MKTYDFPQGSMEWINARLGIPSASNFHKIISPTGRPSAQAETYMNQLIAEHLIGQPCLVGDDSPWMLRGSELEEEAVRWYELKSGNEVSEVGFCVRDDGLAGCSPDRLVGADGLLEVKCPAAHTHVGYLRDAISEKYKPQVQGQLWVTGRAWVDFMSYCPGFKAPLNAVLVRVERDETFIAALEAEVRAFHSRMLEEMLRLTAGGQARPEGATTAPPAAPKKRGRPKKVRDAEALAGVEELTRPKHGPAPETVTFTEVIDGVQTFPPITTIKDEDPDFDPFADLDPRMDEETPIALTPERGDALLKEIFGERADTDPETLLALAKPHGEKFVKESPPRSGTWWYVHPDALRIMGAVGAVKVAGSASGAFPLATPEEIKWFVESVREATR